MAAKQTALHDFERHSDPTEGEDLTVLTEAEREVYEEVRQGEYGPREYAQETSRSPGTVGNLLARADDKLDNDS